VVANLSFDPRVSDTVPARRPNWPYLPLALSSVHAGTERTKGAEGAGPVTVMPARRLEARDAAVLHLVRLGLDEG
jgi:hypothetical protein